MKGITCPECGKVRDMMKYRAPIKVCWHCHTDIDESSEISIALWGCGEALVESAENIKRSMGDT